MSKYRFDINGQYLCMLSKNGILPLHEASKQGDNYIIRIIIDSFGRTPKQIFEKNEESELIGDLSNCYDSCIIL
jgi:hypothetical protein